MTLTDDEIGETMRSLIDSLSPSAGCSPMRSRTSTSSLVDFTISGDKVLVNQRFRGRGAGSGMDMEVDSWAVWTIDETGLATKIEFFLEHGEAEARRAAGLPESDD